MRHECGIPICRPVFNSWTTCQLSAQFVAPSSLMLFAFRYSLGVHWAHAITVTGLVYTSVLLSACDSPSHSLLLPAPLIPTTLSASFGLSVHNISSQLFSTPGSSPYRPIF